MSDLIQTTAHGDDWVLAALVTLLDECTRYWARGSASKHFIFGGHHVEELRISDLDNS